METAATVAIWLWVTGQVIGLFIVAIFIVLAVVAAFAEITRKPKSRGRIR